MSTGMRLVAESGVEVELPADRSWGIRDFVVVDAAGALWRIGQSISGDVATP
jgi:uncharacterized glyoxalase superfamily protein PhnB